MTWPHLPGRHAKQGAAGGACGDTVAWSLRRLIHLAGKDQPPDQESLGHPKAVATAAYARRRNRSEGRRSRRCQSLIEKLKREQARALSSHQYPSESCPVCLEDFRPGPRDARPSAPPLSDDKVRLR